MKRDKTRTPTLLSSVQCCLAKVSGRRYRRMETTKIKEPILGHGGYDIISNFRFADDIMLLASTLSQFKQIMSDWTKTARKLERQIHPDRTKIMTILKQQEKKYIGNANDINTCQLKCFTATKR